jgi:acetyl esterase
MPLDAQTKALMDQLASAGLPLISSLPLEQARRVAFAAFPTDKLEHVACIEDRKIPGPAGSIMIRTYLPEGSGLFPALVYFHGGGFVLGDLESHDPLCRSLTNAARCATVAVEYRLAPENKFPAAPDDCYAATHWVSENGAEIGVDGSRLAVGGDSAGGNLAAAVALMARERKTPQLRLQLLMYPSLDATCSGDSYRRIENQFPPIQDCKYFWSSYIRSEVDRKNPLVSPVFASDLKGLPPALVITAEYDPLIDEGELYAEKLREAGNEVTQSRYSGTIHGFVSMAGVIDKGKAGIAEAAAALRRTLGT